MCDPQKAHYLVITGIILKDEKFLITKRALTEKAFPNQWTVPGGKLELDDYAKRPKDTSAHWYNIFENLLRREVMEETGLKIKNIRYITKPSVFNPHLKVWVCHWFCETRKKSEYQPLHKCSGFFTRINKSFLYTF